MHQIKCKISKLIKAFNSGIFAVCILTFSLAFVTLCIIYNTKPVYICDGDEVSITFTMSSQPETILKEQGIVTMAYDVIDFTGFNPNQNIAEITITRAFEVFVTENGEQTSHMVTGGTVEDLLQSLNIEFGEHDDINLPLGMYVAPGDDVVIVHNTEKTYTVTEVIPFEIEVRPTSLIKTGRTTLLQAGQNGERVLTYKQIIEDGEIIEEILVSDQITQPVLNQITLKGVYGAAVSPLNFGTLDENGVPTEYADVLTNQIATGYSARRGAWGASGMTLSYGYVAVDPAVIPYGTRLYIATPDNSFVYGYAIAADTGIGLLDGVIDVDLFYDTYSESCLNGRRYVNIYVLD